MLVVSAVVHELTAVPEATEARLLVVLAHVRLVVPPHRRPQVSRRSDWTFPESEKKLEIGQNNLANTKIEFRNWVAKNCQSQIFERPIFLKEDYDILRLQSWTCIYSFQ